MKALILCGGLGTRLSPLTDTQPKCMVDINGKPVLKRIVDYLHSYNIYDLIVNLHSFPDQVINYFGNELLYYFEPTPLGEEQTEELLSPWLGDDYLVLNGDTLTDLDLNRLITEPCSVRSVANGIYTGVRIVHINKMPQFDKDFNCKWIDMGTPEGLAKARKYFV